MSDHSKEECAEFHRVLEVAREQAGTGSDLDILYRLGYWEAVKDHTRALVVKDEWNATSNIYREALLSMMKILDQDSDDSDCEGNACDALRIAKEALRKSGLILMSCAVSTGPGIDDYVSRPSTSDGIQFERTTTGGKA